MPTSTAGPDPVEILALAVGALALLLGVVNFWRAELRGPDIQVVPVPGSSVVNFGIRKDDGVLMVNIYRDVLITNSAPTTGYVRTIRSELSSTSFPVSRHEVGVVELGSPLPDGYFVLAQAIRRDEPVRLTLAWILMCQPEDRETIKENIRAPRGSLAMTVVLTSLRMPLVGARSFEFVSTTIRPKLDNVELIGWAEEGVAYGI